MIHITYTILYVTRALTPDGGLINGIGAHSPDGSFDTNISLLHWIVISTKIYNFELR